MTSIKVKFRPSTIDGKEGTIYYQVIKNRVVRQQKTDYHIYANEWNGNSSEVVLPRYDKSRELYLMGIMEKIQIDIRHFDKIISTLEHYSATYSTDDVIAEFVANNPENYLFSFMEGVIANLKTLGKIRT